MSASARTFVAVLAGLAAAPWPHTAYAEDGGSPLDAGNDRSSDAARRDEEIHAPELVQFVDASYPPPALAAGLEGRVVLRLTIDANGRVTDAEVIEPAGHGFDEAAREAALRFVFTPARRGDHPVAARILYEYGFELPEPLPAPQPEAPAPAAPESLPPASPQTVEAPVEVFVRGASESDRLRRSAAAVQVIETEQARRKAADLGEVLARSEGVGVRRGGGLGSGTRFSLNGLTDDQIRLFLDGVPLELSGYPFGIANVPVNVVERVEVYRGVVPVRFGADALGGAVNLVTDDDVRGTHGSASYQAGSFGTQRVTVGARHLHEPTGLFARAGGFFDYADNDYPVDVEVPDARGRISPARVHRFHDEYRAAGGNLEAGLVDRPWADRLLLRAFLTDYDKELQHNLVMTVPYGEVEYGELTAGSTVHYEHAPSRRVSIDFVGGYTYGRLAFLYVGSASTTGSASASVNARAPASSSGLTTSSSGSTAASAGSPPGFGSTRATRCGCRSRPRTPLARATSGASPTRALVIR